VSYRHYGILSTGGLVVKRPCGACVRFGINMTYRQEDFTVLFVIERTAGSCRPRSPRTADTIAENYWRHS